MHLIIIGIKIICLVLKFVDLGTVIYVHFFNSGGCT